MTSSATWISGRRRLVAAFVVGLLVACFLVFLLVVYRARFTFATVFWVIGWAAVLATAALLVKAATAFSLDDPNEPANLSSSRRAELEQEKKILLKAIKEVEFDRDMRKIDDADALAITGRYRARAREVIRLLEGEADYELAVEKELARRMALAGGPADSPAPTPAATAAPVCSSCQTVNETDAAFCKKCGGKLS